MRPPVVISVAAAVSALAIIPAVAFGLTPEPDLVAVHAVHDASLRHGAISRIAAPDTSAVTDEDQTLLYTIREGDTLATIAEAHGFDGIDDWRVLYDANPDVEHPDLIEPGAVLRIPRPGEHLERRDLPVPLAAAVPSGAGGGVWWRLAQCESGGRNVVSSNGRYYGFFQFLPSTWRSVGGTGLPTDHAYAEQLRRAQILQSRAGWGQWPACTRALGLR